MKRASTFPENSVASKKVCLISDSGQPLITMDNLPRNMLHLGGDEFATISCFLGHMRIHLRKYTTDEKGVLHPTKDGVSLSPIVWEALHFQLNSFCTFEGTENVLLVKKDVCVSKQIINDQLFLSFQRLFLKKNHAFQFVPECVLLTVEQVRKLDSYADVIRKMVKEMLLSYSMGYFVQKQLGTPDGKLNEYAGDPDRPEGFPELTDSLCKCLKTFISSKITELFVCFGCQVGYDNQLGHDCMTTSAADKFGLYFDKALYSLDWRKVAKHFVEENVDNANFHRLITSDDFFDAVDTEYVFKTVETLYVNNNDNCVYI